MESDYTDVRSEVLLSLVDSSLYNGDFRGLIGDIHERLYHNPMYKKLEKRLISDIIRLKDLWLQREINNFINEKFL